MSNKVFELTNIDMTHLGGPMGSEYTEDRWHKLFDSVEKAKAYAEESYNKERQKKQEAWNKNPLNSSPKKVLKVKYEPLRWTPDQPRMADPPKPDEWTTGDLGWVMYEIKPVEVV